MVQYNITGHLDLTDTEIQELGPWVRGCSRLQVLGLKGMQNLVSLPQLPDSLSFIDAENCDSLEKLDCSFCNPRIHLNFVNCFKLNQEARDLIIQTSTRQFAALPGGEVPSCFTYRASGSSVTAKLNQKLLRTSTKFKACILFFNSEGETKSDRLEVINCNITSKQNALNDSRVLYPILKEHLYIFDFEAEELRSPELVFEFVLSFSNNTRETWEIKECEILPSQLLDHHVDEDYESFRGGDKKIRERRSSDLTSRCSKRFRIMSTLPMSPTEHLRNNRVVTLFCLLFAFFFIASSFFFYRATL